MKHHYSFKTILLLTSFLIATLRISAQVPVAKFNTCKKYLEEYETIDLTDQSTNSPNAWLWQVLDSTGADAIANGDVLPNPLNNGRGVTSQNPQFEFDAIGCFTVKLTATNASGNSTPLTKSCYINVVEPTRYYLGFGSYGPKGDNNVHSEYGSIFDDGGPNLNYGNNQGAGTKSFLKIRPSNGQPVTLKLTQLRFMAGDTLFIYQGDTAGSNNLMGYHSASSNGYSAGYGTASGKLFICFKSDGSLADTGYLGYYYTVQDPNKLLSSQINIARNIINQPSAFVNYNPSVIVKNYTREWYVNDTLRPAYTDKDTLFHTFHDTSTYKICIKMTTCDTSYTQCIYNRNTSCEALFSIGADTSNTFSGIITDLSTVSSQATYLWEFGDGDTSHSRTTVHTYSGQGTYHLCLTVYDTSCTSTYCDSISFDASGNLKRMTPFSIKVVDKNGNSSSVNPANVSPYLLYPNPTDGFLNIMPGNTIPASITIINVLGKTVYQSEEWKENMKVNIGYFPAGIYFVKITDVNGNLNIIKVSKI